MISLYQWAKNNDLAYSTATKMFLAGELNGAFKEGRLTFIPDDVLPPKRQTVSCCICQGAYPQITTSHLKQHGVTLAEYRHQYPEARTVAAEVSQKIISALTGIKRSYETRQKVSQGRSGIIPKNHPRFIVGSYTHSEASLDRMAAAQIGRTHSDETRIKIGDGNRGKIRNEDDILKQKTSLAKYYETQDGHFTGKTHTDAVRAAISASVTARQAEYGAEKRAITAELRAQKTRGKKRTDEQKERYRQATMKRIVDKPWTLRNTKGQKTIEAWLIENNIHYKREFMIEGIDHVFDFYLYDYHTIIEFDGSHHWERQWFDAINKTPEELDQLLLERREKDAIINLRVGRAGYRIVRLFGKNDVGDCKEWPSFAEQMALQF